MDMNQALAPIRPVLAMIGSIVIAVGVLKFFGVQVPFNGGGLELAAIGWLMKAI